MAQWFKITRSRWSSLWHIVRRSKQLNTISQCLCHSSHFIPSHRNFIVVHYHKKKCEYSTIRCFERERQRPPSHNLYYSILLQVFYFIISHCYLSLSVPTLWIKLHHRYVRIGKKHSIYRVWYYPWFQASTGGLRKYPMWTREDYCTKIIHMWISLHQTRAIWI